MIYINRIQSTGRVDKTVSIPMYVKNRRLVTKRRFYSGLERNACKRGDFG